MAKNSEKKKNYIHTIEMRNETEYAGVFEQYKDAISNYMMHLMEEFEFDIDLLVIFQISDDIKSLLKQEKGAALTTFRENRYTVIIDIDALRKFEYDGGLEIAIAMRHELAHVYDLYYATHNKFYKTNPLKYRQERLVDFTIAVGWRFWTEFFAYSTTYKQFKYEYAYPTFLTLVKEYEKLQKRGRGIELLIDSESQNIQSAFDKFDNAIDNFAYEIAKYIAGSSFGKPYPYEYCEKTRRRAAFEAVDNLEYGLRRRLVPLLKNPYGRIGANRMYKLGKYVVENIYGKFNVYPIKHEKYVCFAYCY